MKKFVISCKQLLTQIAGDYMLVMAFFVPIVIGYLIRLGVPPLNCVLSSYFQIPGILSPYYLLFDLFLAMMTPIMLCFSFAMVMLEEIDDKVARYFMITPLGKGGYLFSRIGIPAILSLCLTPIALWAFHISEISCGFYFIIALLAAAFGSIVALMIVSLSGNKLEGMAMTKLAATITLGILPPFFLEGESMWLFAFLPSFWLSKALKDNSMLLAAVGLCVCGVWIISLVKRFARKVSQ